MIMTNLGCRPRCRLAYRLVYVAVLPAAFLLLLVVVSPRMERSLLFGSATIDFLARFLLAVAFSGLSALLPNLDWYERAFYGKGMHLRAPEVEPAPSIFGVARAIFTALASALAVHWAVQVFLPAYGQAGPFIALGVGTLLGLPLLVHRNALLH